MIHSNLYGNYRNRRFSEIFPDADTFEAEYKESPLSSGGQAVTNVQTVYYLLYAQYGNSPIANSDENQFKYKVWSTMFMYGPTWEKRLEVQKKLRELSLDDILTGSAAVYNKAFNDGSAPLNKAEEELKYINEQNRTLYKRSKLDAYGMLSELLRTDVTRQFIGEFKKLFMKVVTPERPLWYVTDEYLSAEEIINGGEE